VIPTLKAKESHVREFSVPADIKVAPDATLSDAVFDAERDDPDRVMFRRKVAGSWEPVTAATFARQVRRLAAGLMARGVKPGDRIGLMSHTRYEWTLCDYAIWTAGAVTVPVYETSSAEQVAWILGDSGAVAVFVESDEHQATVGEVAGGRRARGAGRSWWCGYGRRCRAAPQDSDA